MAATDVRRLAAERYPRDASDFHARSRTSVHVGRYSRGMCSAERREREPERVGVRMTMKIVTGRWSSTIVSSPRLIPTRRVSSRAAGRARGELDDHKCTTRYVLQRPRERDGNIDVGKERTLTLANADRDRAEAHAFTP